MESYQEPADRPQSEPPVTEAPAEGASIFVNPELDPTQLPLLEMVDLHAVSPDYKRVQYYGTTIFFSILLVGLLCAIFYWRIYTQTFWIIFIPTVYLLLLGLRLFLIHKNYQILGYALRERDMLFRRGVFFRTQTILPFNRVQHCEIAEGMIERSFELSTLHIYTAGGESSDLSIPGLPRDTAERLKEYIADKTAARV